MAIPGGYGGGAAATTGETPVPLWGSAGTWPRRLAWGFGPPRAGTGSHAQGCACHILRSGWGQPLSRPRRPCHFLCRPGTWPGRPARVFGRPRERHSARGAHSRTPDARPPVCDSGLRTCLRLPPPSTPPPPTYRLLTHRRTSQSSEFRVQSPESGVGSPVVPWSRSPVVLLPSSLPFVSFVPFVVNSPSSPSPLPLCVPPRPLR